MTTALWLTGFEYGVLSTSGGGVCDYNDNVASIQGSVKRTGNYALQAAATGTASLWGKNFTASAIIVGRVYVHFGSTLANADSLVIRLLVDAGDFLTISFKNSDSKLYAGLSDTKTTPSANVVAINTWYRIDFRANVVGTTWTLDWQIDGVDQTQFSAGGSASTMSRVLFGVGNVTGTHTFDDVVISATTGDYPIGAGGVEGYAPSVDGTHVSTTQIQTAASANITSSTTDAHDQVNTVPIGNVTAYIKQVTAGAYYAEEKVSTALSNIIGAIAILAYRAATATTDKGACYVIDEDAVSTTIWGTVGTTADYSETTVFYKSKILPATAGGWDAAAINALKIRCGNSDDINPVPWWVDLMVEVAYSTGGASTPMTLTGGMTPSGVMNWTRTAVRNLAGALTPSGTLTRSFIRIGYLLGSITPAGVLSYSKSRLMILVGGITPAGTLAKSIRKTIAGALTFVGDFSKEFIAGAHQTLMTLTGGITPSGILSRGFIRIGYLVGSIIPSGTLSYFKARVMTLTGALTPAGTLVKSIGKTIAGGLASAGSLVRSLAKTLAGGSTPSGILTSYKAKVMLLVGSLAGSGVLIKSSLRSLAGGIMPGGMLSRMATVYRTLTGSFTPSGVLTSIKAKAVTFVGGITPTGTLVRVLNLARSLSGSVAAAGTLARSLGRSLSGGMTPAGVMVKSIGQAKAGAITMAGTLGKSLSKLLAGWIASIGIFVKGGSITESWWRDKDDIHTHEAVAGGMVRDAADILPGETPAAGWLRDKDDIHVHEAVGAGLLRDHADIEEES